MSSATVLTRNDRAVLGALFDPEASLTNNTYPPPTLPDTSTTSSTSPTPESILLAAQIKAAEQSAIAPLLSNCNNNTTSSETSPSPSDLSSINSAISSLTGIINTHPSHPATASAHVNRAQATRLLPSALTDPSSVQSIFADLAAAIHLCLSASDARVLASAHAHRGYLLLHATSDASFRKVLASVDWHSDMQTKGAFGVPWVSTTGGRAEQLTPSVLEEAASRDFAIAGRYGDKTAQTLAVKTNPYAKLCGQIVKEALQREIKEFYGVV